MGRIEAGDSAPWFRAPTLEGNARFEFDTVAGRYILLLFTAPGARGDSAAAFRLVLEHRALFDDLRASFFGVLRNPDDGALNGIRPAKPGLRFFIDRDGKIVVGFGGASGGPFWVLLDPALRVIDTAPIAEGRRLFELLQSLPHPQDRLDSNAPVLTVERVFEPDMCRRLIDLFESAGGIDSGFMRDIDGKTVGLIDYKHKRRADHVINDEGLRAELRARIEHHLLPSVKKAFQFEASRIERYIVACYDGESGGHFRAHRDNTTKGTAHRRFACTINLNTGYDGGDLQFPEYSARSYRAPPGGAVVFSCSMLHAATRVTRGRRYAFLPFLYDDMGAEIRERNQQFLVQAESG